LLVSPIFIPTNDARCNSFLFTYIQVLPSAGFDRPGISLGTLSRLQVRKLETVDSIPDKWQRSFSSLPSPDIFGTYSACHPAGRGFDPRWCHWNFSSDI